MRRKKILVASSTTSPVDPFGGATNRSLMIEKTGTGANTPQMNMTMVERTFGILTFDAYIEQSSPNWDTSLLSFYVLDGSNLGIVANLSFVSPNTNFTVYEPNPGPGISAYTKTGAFSVNTAFNVKVEFFANQTYSVYVNNSLVTFPTTGSVVGYYSASATSLETVRFGTIDSARTESRVYVDNVVLSVPEPGTSALFGLGAVAALYGFRRRKAVGSSRS